MPLTAVDRFQRLQCGQSAHDRPPFAGGEGPPGGNGQSRAAGLRYFFLFSIILIELN
jgi:hypothetical protein